MDVADRKSQESIEMAVQNMVPASALATFGRWWQMETWLRTLVYLELRSRYGAGWTQRLTDTRESQRKNREVGREYMLTPDQESPLAYVDVTGLFDLVEKDWDLFEPCLLPRRVWDGRVDEMRHIRHRLSHCRRPHTDDHDRIVQTLRDLEPGVRRAATSFNTTSAVGPEVKDPLVHAWVKGHHPDAGRLIEHCQRQYGVSFRLRYSVRPWAGQSVRQIETVSNVPGLLWEARFTFGGDRRLEPADLWRASGFRAILPLILFVTMDEFVLRVSFASVDDPDGIADAIGILFDSIIEESTWTRGRKDDFVTPWKPHIDGTDSRLQIGTQLALVDENTPSSVSVLGA